MSKNGMTIHKADAKTILSLASRQKTPTVRVTTLCKNIRTRWPELTDQK